MTAVAERLGGALGSGSTTELELRLRRAGLGTMTAAAYRRRQLAYTVVGLAIGISLALLLRLNTTLALVVAGIGGGVGAIRMRAKVDGLIDDRQTVMRAEAHTVCQMLAVWLRTGDTPAGALDRLAHRTTGIVPGELAEASAQIRSGAPPADVLERLATQTAEPSAARLYRLYGATWSAGGDPASLLALSDSLRASRRDVDRPHDGSPPHRDGVPARRRDRPDPHPLHRRRPALNRVRSLIRLLPPSRSSAPTGEPTCQPPESAKRWRRSGSGSRTTTTTTQAPSRSSLARLIYVALVVVIVVTAIAFLVAI